jgi:pimeloyl-ACP methyl ester carboxylesterase
VWPTRADSALRAERKVIPVPALILAGELSPFFPGSYAEKAGENFSNPTVAVFPNLTGLPLRDGPECVRDLRLAFLRDPKATLDVEACKAQVPEIKFEGTS